MSNEVAEDIKDWPRDLIAWKWANTLSAGEQSVLLGSSVKRLQQAINLSESHPTPDQLQPAGEREKLPPRLQKKVYAIGERLNEAKMRITSGLAPYGSPTWAEVASLLDVITFLTATPAPAPVEQRAGMIQCNQCHHWWVKFEWQTGPTSYCRVPNCGCKCTSLTGAQCVNCGHNDVDNDGRCIEAIPNTGECRDTVKWRACNCKCVFTPVANSEEREPGSSCFCGVEAREHGFGPRCVGWTTPPASTGTEEMLWLRANEVAKAIWEKRAYFRAAHHTAIVAIGEMARIIEPFLTTPSPSIDSEKEVRKAFEDIAHLARERVNVAASEVYALLEHIDRRVNAALADLSSCSEQVSNKGDRDEQVRGTGS